MWRSSISFHISYISIGTKHILDTSLFFPYNEDADSRNRSIVYQEERTMNTFERVRSVVARTLDRDEAEIGPETSLKNDIATDSLEDVEILLALEQEFCMDLGDDVAYMTTVQQIVDHIEGRLGGRSLVLEESVS